MSTRRNRLLSWSALWLCGATLVSAADSGSPLSLFNGKDLSGWKIVGGKSTNQWQVGRAALNHADPKRLTVAGPAEELVSPASGVNLATEASYGDCHLELEFLLAKGSNSGVKLMNIYEIQMLDSFGKTTVGKGDCGAVYEESAPRVNACRKPGEWQTLAIDFRGPRFDAAGAKTASACFVKVVLNGQTIQENVTLERGTGGGGRVAKEHPTGPVYLQGDHGPVAFRNLRLTPLQTTEN